jgi:hypothetical protein
MGVVVLAFPSCFASPLVAGVWGCLGMLGVCVGCGVWLFGLFYFVLEVIVLVLVVGCVEFGGVVVVE